MGDGRDAWFLSLFKDGSLRELHEDHCLFTPLAHVVGDDPDRLIPLVVPLVGNDSPDVHDNAVNCLVNIDRPDALRPLVPWLANAEWSSVG